MRPAGILGRAVGRHAMVVMAALAAGAAAPAGADPRDRDDLRHAVERGEIRPLSDMLGVVARRLPGDVVGVEIEHEQGRWIYELRVIDRKGRMLDVYVDARSGEIDQIKEK